MQEQKYEELENRTPTAIRLSVSSCVVLDAFRSVPALR